MKKFLYLFLSIFALVLFGCSDNDDGNKKDDQPNEQDDVQLLADCNLASFVPKCTGTQRIYCGDIYQKIYNDDCADNGKVCGEINGIASCYTPCSKEGDVTKKCDTFYVRESHTLTCMKSNSNDILYISDDLSYCDEGTHCSTNENVTCVPDNE